MNIGNLDFKKITTAGALTALLMGLTAYGTAPKSMSEDEKRNQAGTLTLTALLFGTGASAVNTQKKIKAKKSE